MNLICKMVHMRGSALGVGGNRYEVGDDGVLRDIAPEHAELLLKDPGGWAKEPLSRTPVQAPKAAKAPAKTPIDDEPTNPGMRVSPSTEDIAPDVVRPRSKTTKKTARRRG